MTRQPEDKRYSLRCLEVNEYTIDCETINSGGHIDDFKTYEQAKAAASTHAHAVMISFWRHTNHNTPSDNFISDFENLEFRDEENE